MGWRLEGRNDVAGRPGPVSRDSFCVRCAVAKAHRCGTTEPFKQGKLWLL